MKQTVTSLILLFVSTLALALPAPKEIDAAVKAGNLAQAETMLHEVIAAKPGSAKAHYELGQVLAREGKYEAARNELLAAERIDPLLTFASDPLQFRNLVNRLAGTARTPAAVEHPAHVAVPARSAESTFPWGYVLAGGGVLLILWLLGRRLAAPAATAPAAGGYGSYGGYTSGGVPAPQAGSGIGGALLGGAAGLAAGYGLAKMLEDDEGSGQRTAIDAGPPIDAADFGDFDAGTGSDWDSGDASAGDDSW